MNFQMREGHIGEDKCSVGTGHRTVVDGVTLDSLFQYSMIFLDDFS